MPSTLTNELTNTLVSKREDVDRTNSTGPQPNNSTVATTNEKATKNGTDMDHGDVFMLYRSSFDMAEGVTALGCNAHGGMNTRNDENDVAQDAVVLLAEDAAPIKSNELMVEKVLYEILTTCTAGPEQTTAEAKAEDDTNDKVVAAATAVESVDVAESALKTTTGVAEGAGENLNAQEVAADEEVPETTGGTVNADQVSLAVDAQVQTVETPTEKIVMATTADEEFIDAVATETGPVEVVNGVTVQNSTTQTVTTVVPTAESGKSMENFPAGDVAEDMPNIVASLAAEPFASATALHVKHEAKEAEYNHENIDIEVEGAAPVDESCTSNSVEVPSFVQNEALVEADAPTQNDSIADDNPIEREAEIQITVDAGCPQGGLEDAEAKNAIPSTEVGTDQHATEQTAKVQTPAQAISSDMPQIVSSLALGGCAGLAIGAAAVKQASTTTIEYPEEGKTETSVNTDHEITTEADTEAVGEVDAKVVDETADGSVETDVAEAHPMAEVVAEADGFNVEELTGDEVSSEVVVTAGIATEMIKEVAATNNATDTMPEAVDTVDPAESEGEEMEPAPNVVQVVKENAASEEIAKSEVVEEGALDTVEAERMDHSVADDSTEIAVVGVAATKEVAATKTATEMAVEEDQHEVKVDNEFAIDTVEADVKEDQSVAEEATESSVEKIAPEEIEEVAETETMETVMDVPAVVEFEEAQPAAEATTERVEETTTKTAIKVTSAVKENAETEAKTSARAIPSDMPQNVASLAVGGCVGLAAGAAAMKQVHKSLESHLNEERTVNDVKSGANVNVVAEHEIKNKEAAVDSAEVGVDETQPVADAVTDEPTVQEAAGGDAAAEESAEAKSATETESAVEETAAFDEAETTLAGDLSVEDVVCESDELESEEDDEEGVAPAPRSGGWFKKLLFRKKSMTPEQSSPQKRAAAAGATQTVTKKAKVLAAEESSEDDVGATACIQEASGDDLLEGGDRPQSTQRTVAEGSPIPQVASLRTADMESSTAALASQHETGEVAVDSSLKAPTSTDTDSSAEVDISQRSTREEDGANAVASESAECKVAEKAVDDEAVGTDQVAETTGQTSEEVEGAGTTAIVNENTPAETEADVQNEVSAVVETVVTEVTSKEDAVPAEDVASAAVDVETEKPMDLKEDAAEADTEEATQEVVALELKAQVEVLGETETAGAEATEIPVTTTDEQVAATVSDEVPVTENIMDEEMISPASEKDANADEEAEIAQVEQKDKDTVDTEAIASVAENGHIHDGTKTTEINSIPASTDSEAEVAALAEGTEEQVIAETSTTKSDDASDEVEALRSANRESVEATSPVGNTKEESEAVRATDAALDDAIDGTGGEMTTDEDQAVEEADATTEDSVAKSELATETSAPKKAVKVEVEDVLDDDEVGEAALETSDDIATEATVPAPTETKSLEPEVIADESNSASAEVISTEEAEAIDEPSEAGVDDKTESFEPTKEVVASKVVPDADKTDDSAVEAVETQSEALDVGAVEDEAGQFDTTESTQQESPVKEVAEVVNEVVLTVEATDATEKEAEPVDDGTSRVAEAKEVEDVKPVEETEASSADATGEQEESVEDNSSPADVAAEAEEMEDVEAPIRETGEDASEAAPATDKTDSSEAVDEHEEDVAADTPAVVEAEVEQTGELESSEESAEEIVTVVSEVIPDTEETAASEDAAAADTVESEVEKIDTSESGAKVTSTNEVAAVASASSETVEDSDATAVDAAKDQGESAEIEKVEESKESSAEETGEAAPEVDPAEEKSDNGQVTDEVDVAATANQDAAISSEKTEGEDEAAPAEPETVATAAEADEVDADASSTIQTTASKEKPSPVSEDTTANKTTPEYKVDTESICAVKNLIGRFEMFAKTQATEAATSRVNSQSNSPTSSHANSRTSSRVGEHGEWIIDEPRVPTRIDARADTPTSPRPRVIGNVFETLANSFDDKKKSREATPESPAGEATDEKTDSEHANVATPQEEAAKTEAAATSEVVEPSTATTEEAVEEHDVESERPVQQEPAASVDADTSEAPSKMDQAEEAPAAEAEDSANDANTSSEIAEQEPAKSTQAALDEVVTEETPAAKDASEDVSEDTDAPGDAAAVIDKVPAIEGSESAEATEVAEETNAAETLEIADEVKAAADDKVSSADVDETPTTEESAAEGESAIGDEALERPTITTTFQAPEQSILAVDYVADSKPEDIQEDSEEPEAAEEETPAADEPVATTSTEDSAVAVADFTTNEAVAAYVPEGEAVTAKQAEPVDNQHEEDPSDLAPTTKEAPAAPKESEESPATRDNQTEEQTTERRMSSISPEAPAVQAEAAVAKEATAKATVELASQATKAVAADATAAAKERTPERDSIQQLHPLLGSSYEILGVTRANGVVMYHIHTIHRDTGERVPQSVPKRYSEFKLLEEQLRALNVAAAKSLPELPKPTVGSFLRGRGSKKTIELREKAFTEFLHHVQQHLELHESAVFQRFIQQ